MPKVPDVSAIVGEIEDYEAKLQEELDELEEKQNEKETDSRQIRIDELSAKIDLCQTATEALNSLE